VQEVLKGLGDLGFDADSANLDKLAADGAKRIADEKKKASQANASDIAKAAALADKQRKKEEKEEKQAEQKRIQELREQNSVEKELIAARLALLEDGKDKEIAIENERNRGSIADLKVRAVEGKDDQKKLDELEELEAKNHKKNLVAINKKYLDDQEQLVREANEQIQQLTLQGKDLELAQLENSIDKQTREAEKKYKNQADILAKVKEALVAEKAKKTEEINNKFSLQEIEDQEKIAVLQTEGAIKNEEQRELAVMMVKKHYAELKLAFLQQHATKENEEERLQLQNLINSLGDGIKKGAQDLKAKASELSLKNLLVDAFGMNEGDADQAAMAMQSAVGSIMENTFAAIQDGVARIIAEKQKVVDALNEQIDEVESALDRERELQEQGLANNVSIREQELNSLKEQRDQAMKEQEEAQKKAASSGKGSGSYRYYYPGIKLNYSLYRYF